jgi:hypothetical protein
LTLFILLLSCELPQSHQLCSEAGLEPSFLYQVVATHRGIIGNEEGNAPRGVLNRYAKVPGIVNLSILIGIVVWWFGQGIAIIVHAWQLLQSRREQKTPAQRPVSMQAQ